MICRKGDILPIVYEKYFDGLAYKTEDNEPEAEMCNMYDMARKIAKKTKFRVIDVMEVLREVGPCMYMMLLERKSVNLGCIKIRSKWKRFIYPRYVHDKDFSFWSFGYYYPIITFDNKYKYLYEGISRAKADVTVNEISPYFPDGVNNIEDLKKYVKKILYETSSKGKDVIIDSEGYVKPYVQEKINTKRYKFDENFHPTFIEKKVYFAKRRKYINEWRRLVENGRTDLKFDYVINKLREEGFQIGPNDCYENMEDENAEQQ